MLFNSYTFILFFGVVLLLHSLPLSWRVKKLQLLIASYLFYAAWNPPFVALLWVSTLVDWFVARALARTSQRSARRGLLLVSLVTNLCLLGFFKYGNFLLESFVGVTRALGVEFQPLKLDIVLPVGISFYTFQTLSYTIDVYRRRLGPWPSFLDFALYVTFFPQLVAGPIVRAAEFLPQCTEVRRATRDQLGWGLSLLVLGLFEKVVVADSLLAPIADMAYGAYTPPTPLAAWCGTLAFSGQIFCDFAGYSTCAIGIAMCFGFSIPDNFRYPYAAIGFSDFWGRWHISLSTWLRDYLYIPLGGNRKGAARTYVNLMLTMLIGGLWHGASWTFVAWGGLHGTYLAGERFLRARMAVPQIGQRAAVRFALASGTFLLTTLAWAFFRSQSLGQAFSVAGAMLGYAASSAQSPYVGMQVERTLALMATLFLLHWLLRDTVLESVVRRCPWWLRSVVLAAMLVAMATKPGEDRAFIYFQF
jgi:D-alanyl-lipoteichoic acid acyltransferase DltB (MBOAT superfamily)